MRQDIYREPFKGLRLVTSYRLLASEDLENMQNVFLNRESGHSKKYNNNEYLGDIMSRLLTHQVFSFPIKLRQGMI